MQKYKVNNTIFNNIEDATKYVATLNKAVTIQPYTAPTQATIKLNVARNMLVREMLEWAGDFTQSMSPCVDTSWMYSFEDDAGNSDAGDCYFEDLTNVQFTSNLEWEDAKHDHQSAVDNFDCLLGNYNAYDTVESLSDMLNNMYHTMSDHSSETDTYIGAVRDSIKQFCEGNDNIAHSYDHPSRTTTISFTGNIDPMYEDYMQRFNS